MDYNHFNILFLLSDLCYIMSPILGNFVPIVMTRSLFQKIQFLYNDAGEKANRITANKLINYCFQLMIVYLYQQDYANLSVSKMMTNVMFKALESDSRTRFQVWKNLWKVRVTHADFMRVIHGGTHFEVRPTTSITLPDPMPDDENLFLEAYNIINNIEVIEETLHNPNSFYVLEKDISNTEHLLSAFSSCEGTITEINEHDLQKGFEPSFLGKDNIVYRALLPGQLTTRDQVSRELLIWRTRIDLEHLIHSVFDKRFLKLQETPFVELPEPPRLVPIKDYYGPTTEHNTCYLNTVLVCLLMFPNSYFLKKLFQADIQMTHFFDVAKNLCTNNDDRATRMVNFRMKVMKGPPYQVTFKFIKEVYKDLSLDYEYRLACKQNLILLFEAIQSGDLNNINRYRDRVVQLFFNCRSLSNTPNIKFGDQGEPDSFAIFIQNLLDLTETEVVKTRDYTTKTGTFKPCTKTFKEEPSFLWALQLPSNISNRETYSVGQLLIKRDTSFANYICQGKPYQSMQEYISSLITPFICFTITRATENYDPKKPVLDSDGWPVQQAVLNYSIFPQEHLTYIELDLWLRGVIVYQPNHYVCYVLNPFNNVWMYYDLNNLKIVGIYEDMIDHMQQQVLNNGVMYFYAPNE